MPSSTQNFYYGPYSSTGKRYPAGEEDSTFFDDGVVFWGLRWSFYDRLQR